MQYAQIKMGQTSQPTTLQAEGIELVGGHSRRGCDSVGISSSDFTCWQDAFCKWLLNPILGQIWRDSFAPEKEYK